MENLTDFRKTVKTGMDPRPALLHLPVLLWPPTHACLGKLVFPSSLLGRDEKLAPLKTPSWEAITKREGVAKLGADPYRFSPFYGNRQIFDNKYILGTI